MVEKYFFLSEAPIHSQYWILQGILYIYVRGEEGTLKIHRQRSKIGWNKGFAPSSVVLF